MHRRAWILLFPVVTFACDLARNTAGSGEANHTEGELFWQNEPYQWADVDRTTADRVLATKSAPADDLVTTRLGAWVDRYDRVVRDVIKSSAGLTFVAPKPQVRVVPSNDLNAFVSFQPTCLAPAAGAGLAAPPDAAADAPGLAPDAAVEAGPPDAAAADASSGPAVYPHVALLTLQRAFNAAGFPCVESRSWPPDPSLALAWVDKLGGVQVGKAEGGSFEITNVKEFWNFPSDHPLPMHAAQVSVEAALPYVNVYPALVAGLSEKAAAAILAHELGHYYRAHGATGNAAKYDFWYQRDQPAAVRPTPLADQDAYRTRYEALKIPRFLIVGQKYDPRVAPTLLLWAINVHTTPGHVCEPIQTTVRGWSDAVKNDLLYTTVRDLTLDDQRAYLDLEAVAGPCVDTLKLVDGSASDPWGATTAPRQWFVERLAFPLSSATKPEELAQVATLDDLVAKLDAKAKQMDAEGDRFLKDLEANHIGMYTIEQEADEIAMELASRVGITPDEVLDGFLEAMRAIEKLAPASFALHDDHWSTDQCAALLHAGFRARGANGQDEDVYVPLGTLSDPHHAWCYRIFNLYREKLAHGYKPAAPDFPLDEPPWKDVQAHAAALAGTAPPPPPPPPGADAGVHDAGADARAPEAGTSLPLPPPSDDPGPAPREPEDAGSAPPKKGGGCTATSSPSEGAGWLVAALAVLGRRRKRA
jgi:uncharacterized protein (TIGR03382 family)